MTVLLEFELGREDLGPPIFHDKPEMQGTHSCITVAKVARDSLTFLLHPWINEPGLLEHVHFLDRVHRHLPCFPMKLELLSLYPRR